MSVRKVKKICFIPVLIKHNISCIYTFYHFVSLSRVFTFITNITGYFFAGMMTMDLVVIATEIHQRKMNHLDLAEIQVLII